MNSLSFSEMSVVNGGTEVAKCVSSVTAAVVLGTVGIIGAATGPAGWVLFAIGSQLVSAGFAAWGCV